MIGWIFAIGLNPAHAHKPFFDGEWTSAQNAFEIDDPEISIVVYQEITCEDPELWLTFEATASDWVWVQVGVPQVDRLEDYRPSLAVLAPGLPELAADDVPFEIPAGLGGIVYESTESPTAFYEPFTGTSSWIYAEDWVQTPETGTAYVVAWDPADTTGKLWLAVGVVEDFSDVDWSEAGDWGAQANDFHETGLYSDPPEVTETDCQAEASATDNDESQKTSGCANAPTSSGMLPLMFAWLFTLGRKSRSHYPQGRSTVQIDPVTHRLE